MQELEYSSECNRELNLPRKPDVVILGIPFHNVSFADTVEWVRQRVQSRRPAYIATVNMDFITHAWKDPELQRILLEADLVVADGIPIVWLSRLQGFPLKQRVTGSDLVPMFAELAARENFSLYGLGGAEGVAENALNKLSERFPGMRTAGFYSPPKADIIDMDNRQILQRLDVADPDILLVAFGAPKQEKWVNMHIRQWKVPVSIGIGGSLDFLAGAQKRAPLWMQRLALEWLWRMLSNPRRLFRRYVANIAFLFVAVLRILWLRRGPVPSVKVCTVASDKAESDEKDLSFFRVPFSDIEVKEDMSSFIHEVVSGSELPLLVDMETCEWLDGREQGVLLDLSRRCRAANRWMGVLVSHKRLLNLLRMIRIDQYITVVENLREARELWTTWRKESNKGSVDMDADNCLHVILPSEFTAANVDYFRSSIAAVWDDSEVPEGLERVEVDASGVNFIDSAAVGFLVSLRKKALGLSNGFTCSGFHGNALQTLKITRIEKFFMDDVTGVDDPQ